MRSAETISSRPRIARIASTTRCVGVTSSWATNRAARTIRSGSSVNATSGSNGVSSTFAARWRIPP